MILSALNDYYTRLLDDPDSGISAPGYSLEKISYVIVLDRSGSLVSVEDIREVVGKKRRARSLVVPQPEKRTAGIKSNLFWDKTSYVLGISSVSDEARDSLSNNENIEDKDREKLAKKIARTADEHESFKEFHKNLLLSTKDDGLLAFLEFLSSWSPENFAGHGSFSHHAEEFKDANVVFRMDGDVGADGAPRYLHQRPEAMRVRNALLDSDEAKEGVCLVTEDSGPVERLHSAIKGVNGAQSSGASIVSFNLDSFSSYGKSQGDNAPVSKKVSFSYTTALNHLLRREEQNRQRMQIGDATVVFWAQADETKSAESAESLFSAFLDPKDEDARETEELRNALERVKQGIPLSDLIVDVRNDTRIFVLGLAPNASRLSIRLWETDTLNVFAKRLAQHYDDLCLEPSPWKSLPAVWRLLLATAPSRDGKTKSEDVPPQLAGEIARAILTGGNYPRSLLSNLIMRLRADGDISGTRVALIKGVLSRSRRLGGISNNKGEMPVSLDTSNTDPGYLLGRLFASLEGIQRGALGKGINATIRDRFYGAASATPASIFPMLLRNAQNHLSKIRKEKAGLAVNMEKEIGEIIDLLGTAFPRSLRMEAQGNFAIGYYHQSQARYARNSDQDDTDSE